MTKRFGYLAGLLLCCVYVGQVQAATSAGATIFNQATLTYNGGTVDAAITVGVSLVPTAPTLNSPPDPATSTTSGAQEPITYTITSQANGKDTYDLSYLSVDTCTLTCGTLGTPTVAFLSGATGSTTITGIDLDAVITSGPSNASGQILIPAGSETNNLVTGITVSIGGNTYTVGTITPGTVAAINTAEVPTKVALSPGGSNPGGAIGDGTGGTTLIPAGTQVGQVAQFRTVVTAGTLSGGATKGTHNVTTKAASHTDSAQNATDAVLITVVPVQVDVIKQVANTADTSCGTPPCYNGSGVVNAKSGDTLIYKITMSVPSTATADLTGAQLVDTPPAYTTYIANSLTLNSTQVSTVAPVQGGTSPGDGGTLPLAAGFTVNSPGGGDGSGFNGSGTAGVIVKGGIAVVTFEVTVN